MTRCRLSSRQASAQPLKAMWAARFASLAKTLRTFPRWSLSATTFSSQPRNAPASAMWAIRPTHFASSRFRWAASSVHAHHLRRATSRWIRTTFRRSFFTFRLDSDVRSVRMTQVRRHHRTALRSIFLAQRRTMLLWCFASRSEKRQPENVSRRSRKARRCWFRTLICRWAFASSTKRFHFRRYSLISFSMMRTRSCLARAMSHLSRLMPTTAARHSRRVARRPRATASPRSFSARSRFRCTARTHPANAFRTGLECRTSLWKKPWMSFCDRSSMAPPFSCPGFPCRGSASKWEKSRVSDPGTRCRTTSSRKLACRDRKAMFHIPGARPGEESATCHCSLIPNSAL